MYFSCLSSGGAVLIKAHWPLWTSWLLRGEGGANTVMSLSKLLVSKIAKVIQSVMFYYLNCTVLSFFFVCFCVHSFLGVFFTLDWDWMNEETVKSAQMFDKKGFSAVFYMDCPLIVNIFSSYFYLNTKKEKQFVCLWFINYLCLFFGPAVGRWSWTSCGPLAKMSKTCLTRPFVKLSFFWFLPWSIVHKKNLNHVTHSCLSIEELSLLQCRIIICYTVIYFTMNPNTSTCLHEQLC